MPFFSSKFSPKKVPIRKSSTSIISKELGPDFAAKELGLDIPPIRLKLDDYEISFEDGRWNPESGPPGAAHKENAKLRKSLKQLEEENNLLKLKYEIILDMLTQTTAESQIQMKEIEQLKQSSEKSILKRLRQN